MKAGSATGSVAVGYYRVSTKRQATEGISLTDQQAAVRTFCEQEGLALVDEYIERGASARSGDRPELQRLLADAKAKPRAFDTIVVYSRSRFYRDAPTMELTLRDLRKRGIELVSVSQPVSRSAGQPVSRDESGDLVRQIIAVVDEHASRETAKHVRSTMRANAAAGYWNGSKAPFGYRTFVCETIGKKQKKKLAIDEVEASTVRLIYRLAQVGDARSGPMGVKAIVNHLNGAGYRSPKGKMWHVGPLHALLTNPVYKGTYVYNRTDSRNGVGRPAGEHIEVSCPAIVTPAVWNAVQTLMRERNPKIAPPKTIAGPILLTGLVRCASCSGALTIRTGKSGRYRYYTCATSQARGKTACPGRSIRMEKLDVAVTRTLVDRLFEPSRLLSLIRSVEERGAAQRTDGSEELVRVEGELTDAAGRLDRLYAAVERGLMDLDDPDLAKRVTAAQRDRAIATAAKERILARMGPRTDLTPEQVVRVAGLMRDRIQNGAVPFRKSYIRAVVEAIVVDERKAVITGHQDALWGCVNANDTTPATVPRSVQEWRARKDSNL